MDWFRNVPNVIRSHSENQENSLDKQEDRFFRFTQQNNEVSPKRKTSEEKKLSIDHLSNYSTSSGMSTNAVQQNDELICVLCGDLFTNPRLLPCLHSFCKRCLEHTVNPRSTTLSCHVCRKEVQMKVWNAYFKIFSCKRS